MANEAEKFTRQQLYELVWTTPVHQLAPRYNLSDVGFAKLCRRFLIPLPPRGYWRRKEFGYKVKLEPMTKWPEAREPVIHLSRTSKPKEVQPNPNQEAEKRPENRVVVPPELPEKVHPFVRHTASLLRRSKADSEGRLSGRDEKSFVVQVSRGELDRALRILQAFTEACEKRGFELNGGRAGGGGVSLVVAGQRIHFVIEERLRRVRHELTRAEELALQRPYPPRDIRKWDYQPDGVLVLKLVGLPWTDGVRLWWADKQTAKLEDRLNEVMAVLPVVAERLRLHNEEVERQRQEREQAERRRQEALERAEVRVARFRFLEEQAELWERRERVLAYVRAVRERLERGEWGEKQKATAEQWLAWAGAYLGECDPTNLLFLNELLTADSKLFPSYRYSPRYGEARDEWLALWERAAFGYY